MESGQNIVYGKKNEKENNKIDTEEEDYNDDEFQDINYDDLDYDINATKTKNSKNKSKTNTNNSKSTNLKLSKLNNAATPYERLQLLSQLELENKKKTQELIDNLTNNQNNDEN